MNLNHVIKRFQLLSGLSGEEVSKWLPVCRDAMDYIESRTRKDVELCRNSRRLSHAAAVFAYYKYTLYSNSDNYQRFTAADITITRSGNTVQQAKNLWLEEQQGISDLLVSDNNDFIFKRIKFWKQ